MEQLLTEVGFWHWLVLGVALLILEIFAPGTFFLWMAVSACAVGVILWLVPGISLEWQVLLFAVLAGVSVLLWRRYQINHPVQSDEPRLNRRGEQYVGRVFTLEEPILNGRGKIRVDDSIWRVDGADCEAGTRVRVTEVDGVVLRVEPEGSDTPP